MNETGGTVTANTSALGVEDPIYAVKKTLVVKYHLDGTDREISIPEDASQNLRSVSSFAEKEARASRIDRVLQKYLNRFDQTSLEHPVRTLQLSGVATLHDQSEFDELIGLICAHGRKNPMTGDVSGSIPSNRRLEFFMLAANIQFSLDDPMTIMTFRDMAFAHHLKHGTKLEEWKSAIPP